MDIVKGTDLPDLLSHLGYQVRRLGSYYTTREMDSIRIKDRRRWRRYSTGQGGDAITFLQVFCDKSFPEAVEYLTAIGPGTLPAVHCPGWSPGKQKKSPLPCPRPTRISAGCSPISRSGASPPR